LSSGRPAPCGLAAKSAARQCPLRSKKIGNVAAALKSCTPRERKRRREKNESLILFLR
jgi:hypothetical protein